MAYRLEDLVLRRALDRPLELLLSASVRAAFNIVISGPAGSGKTTLLNALCAGIPPRERRERPLLGDVHGDEALHLLHAMAHGPGGALATVRTASADDALHALATLAGRAGPTTSTTLAETTAGHAVDLIVHLERSDDGERHVGEVALPVLQGRRFGLATLALFSHDDATPSGRFHHYPLSTRLEASGEPIPSAFRTPTTSP